MIIVIIVIITVVIVLIIINITDHFNVGLKPYKYRKHSHYINYYS